MPLDRSTSLARAAKTGASTPVAGPVIVPALAKTPDAARQPGGDEPQRYSFSVMGTTDLHGHIYNWDYRTNAEYADPDDNHVGLAKISTLVSRIRAEKGAENTLLIDAGDILQGTQLAYYYAKVEPITGADGPVHPMAWAMNAIGYDAATLGNHEFNYGIPLLRAFERQCDFPLLGANALDAATARPAFPPYWMTTLPTPGGRGVRVAVLGLTNPGVAIWDRAQVEGAMTFPSLEEEAARYVPRLRSLGADVVIVSAHSGTSGTSSYGDRLPHVENVAALVAERVPDIDAILVGHAHLEVEEHRVTNEQTGREVVLSEPLYWGQRLTLFDFAMVFERGRWTVESVSARLLKSRDVPEDPGITGPLAEQHRKVVDYGNQVIGTAIEGMTASEAQYKDTPIMGFINHVQTETVQRALAGTAHEALPILAQAACFSRSAAIPVGDVTIRDIAGMYVFENTLEARLITGAQLKDFLEQSARFFVQTPPGGEVDPDQLIHADDIPEFNYDVISGVTYDIDIAQPPGSRIANLNRKGEPVADDAEFALAVNSYRASGGGDFPHIADAKQLWSDSQEVRTTIISWVERNGEIDPARFASVGWRLTRDGEPIF